MSRRGGPLKRGPDLSWDDAPDEGPSAKADENLPAPTFPARPIRTPKPMTASEKSAAQAFLDYRARCRRGPLYCDLDRSLILDAGETKRSKAESRRGFDVFSGQDKWKRGGAGVRERKRTVPDLKTHGQFGFTLRLFPEELWGVLDPDRRMEGWDGLRQSSLAWGSAGVKKRPVKRRKVLRKVDNNAEDDEEGSERDSSGDDEDVIGGADRKRMAKAARSRREDATNKSSAQKKGLDAEDEEDEREQIDVEDEDAGEDEEPVDSEFEESDDGQGDDYNAEQYFDGGDDDDFGGGDGGGDDDGGAF